MTSPDGSASTSDVERIRRDIERTQSTLSSDVDALTEKVTPGRIVDRRVGRARGAVRRWTDTVMGSGGGRHTVTGTHGGGGHIGGGHHPAAAARSVADSVSGTTSAAAAGVSDAASGAAGTVQETVQQTPQAVRAQTQGNPLAAGLIAFGAGWLVSSLIPASRHEQDLAEQAKDRAGELGAPLAEAAGEVRDNLAGPAQQAAEAVRSSATGAGRAVADEGRAAAGQVQEQAQDAAGHVRQNASH